MVFILDNPVNYIFEFMLKMNLGRGKDIRRGSYI